MYGTQAIFMAGMEAQRFENDVNMYGTQAQAKNNYEDMSFENDVNMYGTQADGIQQEIINSLRMM